VSEVIVTLWLNHKDQEGRKGLSLLHLRGLPGLCGWINDCYFIGQ